MKVAICLSGHLRTFEQTFESVKKLLGEYDCDIFISTWKNSGNVHTYHATFKEGDDNTDEMISVEKIRDLYKPISMKMDDANTEPTSLKLKQMYKGIKTQSGANMDQTMVMLYKMWDCNQLKIQHELNNNFKYDITIRLRFDIFVKCINTEMAKQCVQFIPGHMGVADMMFLGPSKYMDDIFDLYTILSPNIPFVDFFNIEQMWQSHAINNEIPINISYEAFDYHRYNFRGIYDPRGNKVE